MRAVAVLSFAISLTLPFGAAAQFPPEKLKNVKAFPAGMPVRELVDSMRGFTRALGVRCTYCHVGEESQPLSSYDFASDEKPAKKKARAMIEMMSAINGNHLASLPERRSPPVGVGCATCHRGVTEPRPLQQVLLTAYDAAGPDSAESVYRALRQRYYGRAAYDFGEVPLADFGAALQAKDHPADGLRFLLLNVEFLPTSGFARRQAAAAQLAAGDTAAARANLLKALEINANDGQAKQALERLNK